MAIIPCSDAPSKLRCAKMAISSKPHHKTEYINIKGIINRLVTKEEHQIIEQLAAAGLPAREIGEKLNRSRLSIIGYCHRQGIILLSRPWRLRMTAEEKKIQKKNKEEIRRLILGASIIPKSTTNYLATNMCATDGCKNTRQPGRTLCRDCLLPLMPRRTRGVDIFDGPGIGHSSLL